MHTAMIGADGFMRSASTTWSERSARTARVEPQPGQGMCVTVANGQRMTPERSAPPSAAMAVAYAAARAILVAKDRFFIPATCAMLPRMMVDQSVSANAIVHAAGGYGPPGGGYPPPGGGGYPPGGGYGGPPGGGPPGGFGAGGPGAPPGGGYGVPPGAPPPGGFGAPPPGGFGGPPGFPPPQMGPGGDINTTLTMILAIVTLACCCTPLGIVSLINVMNANNAKKTGDLATAQAKNKSALTFAIVGMVGGVVIWTAVIILQLVQNNAF
jgi:hypothetical protein